MEQKVNCPSCGSVNNVGQQFCGACGTKLAGEREQEVVSVSQPEVVSERQPEVVSERQPEVVSQRQPEVVSERQQNVVRVVESLASPRQADVKPTWGLAWGLYWRMALLSLLIGGAVYLIFAIVWLALGFQLAPPLGF
ncbi:MAG: zinc ribbon domain-containing protein [Dehalococcoidia bacterium]|nr:zinc ribbon domain-containing protein [Dehalococcoidia bacterium]